MSTSKIVDKAFRRSFANMVFLLQTLTLFTYLIIFFLALLFKVLAFLNFFLGQLVDLQGLRGRSVCCRCQRGERTGNKWGFFFLAFTTTCASLARLEASNQVVGCDIKTCFESPPSDHLYNILFKRYRSCPRIANCSIAKSSTVSIWRSLVNLPK